MKKLIKVLCLCIAALSIITLSACGSTNQSAKSENKDQTAAKQTTEPKTEIGELSKGSCTVLFTMDDGNTFTVKCEPEYAPETVENFLSLVDSGFYDGLTFHRILDRFVAQGGDPNGNGTGGSDKKVKGEFSANGFTQNTLTHKRGSVAMARSSAPDSASSQFYICYEDLPSLDGNYAVFGEVIQGMEVIDGFLSVERDNSGMPKTPITIKSAKIID